MPSEPARPSTAVRLDHYRLERRLALGGMAEIFLATDEKSGRRVAVKKILPQIATDKDFLDRFFHEIRIQISLKHKNIVELLDCSPAPDNAYIVMEYVDGGSLHALREDVGTVPWEISLHAVEEGLRGLAVAHKKGIVHRDIKPQNIMWTTEGTVKIADFGISQAANLTRLTVTGTVVGTPAHMSPEQARGETLDARSDLFSVGTVLYELLTGFNPFLSDSITATLRRVVDIEPEPPSLLDPTIPPGIDVLLRKMHAKDRAARFKDADEACEAIDALLVGEGVLNVAGIFRAFLSDPSGFVRARKKRLATESAATAEKLLADKSAAPEEALWAAYRTVSCAPDDPAARALFQAAATRAGQREKPLENAKIKDLEEKLRKDPENVPLLLQLAKLYRLEKDFLNVMKFFRKLQAVAPGDAYTQGQIAALVGGPTGAAAGVRRRISVLSAARTSILPVTAVPAPPGTSKGKVALITAGATLLLVFSLWWARRPHLDMGVGTAEDRERGSRIAELLKGRPPAPAAPAPRPRGSEDDAVQKVLEKGALLEKEGGPAKALAFYRETLEKTTRDDLKGHILLVLAEAAEKAGDRSSSLEALDDAIALGGPERTTALFRKADLLAAAHDDPGARRIWDELVKNGDAEARTEANLRLAMASDKAGDAAHALTLYEEIVSKTPGAPAANPARLGAAALYRAASRRADAQRMYQEVKRTAPPGSDFEKSADAGLKTLE